MSSCPDRPLRQKFLGRADSPAPTYLVIPASEPPSRSINYMLRRRDAFTRFLDDGRICLTNNAAKRALRCVPLARKAWLYCGSDRGGQRAAVLYTLIQTARLNDVDPQAWLADGLSGIADCPVRKLGDLLPWNWHARQA